MKKFYLLFILVLSVSGWSFAQQSYQQYFDGADTSASNSILIQLDTASTNIWQVGQPLKIIFDSAATAPNAIVTDTNHIYPKNNISRFTFKVKPWTPWGILAIQWKQKLDMEKHHAGGVIEYSIDTANTWTNIFNDPHVYNLYGFLPANQDTLWTGDVAFSGTDSSWRDVWLCFDMSWLSFNDSIYFRYTFVLIQRIICAIFIDAYKDV